MRVPTNSHAAICFIFFFSSRRRHTRCSRDWSSDVCSSDLNMPGIASAATAVVIGYIAGGTKTIRVGSGGIMLPNHSPLVIAEQFGTLASLYPGRIELGLGRAPGTDMPTARALRRDMASTADNFPQDVQELISYFEEVTPGQEIRAVPGGGGPGRSPPPIEYIDAFWSPAEKASAAMTLLISAVGSPETVERALLKFIDVTQPDEIIVTAHIYDHAPRLRSFELLAGVRAGLAARESSSDLEETPSSEAGGV